MDDNQKALEEMPKGSFKGLDVKSFVHDWYFTHRDTIEAALTSDSSGWQEISTLKRCEKAVEMKGFYREHEEGSGLFGFVATHWREITPPTTNEGE